MERGARQATQIMKAAGPFLSRLPPRVAEELVGAASIRRFGPGETILEQGRKGEHLYIVGEGEVEVVRLSPDDKTEVALVTLGMGECFGEMSLLTGEATSATVRSRGHSTVLLLSSDRLEELLARYPALGRAFSKLLADRLKATNVSLESELDRGIIGRLSLINLIDLVQTLSTARRTGTLTITHRGMRAELAFREGRLISARVGDEKGEEAFYGLLAWLDGDFCFEQGEVAEEGEIRSDTMGLLMEGLRRLDDMSRMAEN
jgi:CRP-like cAMP-binding protein